MTLNGMDEHMSDGTYAAANLKKLRESKKLSRQNLIDELKKDGLSIHATSLRRIEEGEQPMKVNEASHFASYFGISLDQFIEIPIDEGFVMLQRDLALIDSAREKLESALFDFIFHTKAMRISYSDKAALQDLPPQGDLDLLLKQVKLGEKLISQLEKVRCELAGDREPPSVDQFIADLGIDNGSR